MISVNLLKVWWLFNDLENYHQSKKQIECHWSFLVVTLKNPDELGSLYRPQTSRDPARNPQVKYFCRLLWTVELWIQVCLRKLSITNFWLISPMAALIFETAKYLLDSSPTSLFSIVSHPKSKRCCSGPSSFSSSFLFWCSVFTRKKSCLFKFELSFMDTQTMPFSGLPLPLITNTFPGPEIWNRIRQEKNVQPDFNTHNRNINESFYELDSE